MAAEGKMTGQRFSKRERNDPEIVECIICGKSDYDLIHKNINTWDLYQWWTDEEDGGEIVCDDCKQHIEKGVYEND